MHVLQFKHVHPANFSIFDRAHIFFGLAKVKVVCETSSSRADHCSGRVDCSCGDIVQLTAVCSVHCGVSIATFGSDAQTCDTARPKSNFQ
jgi:hypothetical protein